MSTKYTNIKQNEKTVKVNNAYSGRLPMPSI